jgi:hypothetical protein
MSGFALFDFLASFVRLIGFEKKAVSEPMDRQDRECFPSGEMAQIRALG